MFYNTIFDIKSANRTYADKSHRAYWFDPATMSCFSTRLHEKVYGGRYFITSEQFQATEYSKEHLGWTDGERRYSVRVCKSNGSIDTISDHMKYQNLEEAELCVDEILLMTKKYLHTPAAPGYGDQLMVLKSSDPEVIDLLNFFSVDEGARSTYYLMLSGAEVGVWEYNQAKFGPTQFQLVTQHAFSKVENAQGIELVTAPLK